MSKPDTIDELVLFDKDTHDKSCGVTITRDLGNCDCDKLELKAALSAMIFKDVIGNPLTYEEAFALTQNHKAAKLLIQGSQVTIDEQNKRAIDMGFTL